MAKYQIKHLDLGQETNAISHDRVKSILKKNSLRIMEEIAMKNCGIYLEKRTQKLVLTKDLPVILSTNLILLSI